MRIIFWYNAGMDIGKAQQLLAANKIKFDEFYSLLTEANKSFNLTAVCERNEVKIKHFLDSVLPADEFFKGADVAEIGSGGGFPSVPLKIVRPDLKFTLIESTGKKCGYLKEVVDKLGLDGVQVVNIRAEDGARDNTLREKFDISTARAVARLNTLCEYCLPYVKVGGLFIAYKGEAAEEIKEAENAIKILGGELIKTVNYELPEGMGKRCAVVIKKVRQTPVKYPRGQGRERKNPL